MFAGRTDYGAHDPVASLAELRKGTMRILAVSTGKRVDSQPDIPTMTEQGVPMDMTLWWAAMVPAGVPAPVKAQIRDWFVKAVSDPETKKFVNQFGGDPLVEPVEESNKRWARNIEEWKQWAKLAKIEPQ
jgi:tripartite-type tricarboxylate transporter receptor subunit TctC